MTANEKHGCHGGDGATLPAPLLTASDAKEARRMLGSMSMHANAEQAWRVYDAIEALADGRTRCVEVLSEEEHRAALQRWVRSQGGTDPNELEHDAWMACARAMGAVR